MSPSAEQRARRAQRALERGDYRRASAWIETLDPSEQREHLGDTPTPMKRDAFGLMMTLITGLALALLWFLTLT